jgi:hypothetical protein
MYTIEKVSIIKLIMMFVFYIITHYGIGYHQQQLEKKENKTEEELKILKQLRIAFTSAWIIPIYLSGLFVGKLESCAFLT